MGGRGRATCRGMVVTERLWWLHTFASCAIDARPGIKPGDQAARATYQEDRAIEQLLVSSILRTNRGTTEATYYNKSVPTSVALTDTVRYSCVIVKSIATPRRDLGSPMAGHAPRKKTSLDGNSSFLVFEQSKTRRPFRHDYTVRVLTTTFGHFRQRSPCLWPS